jgi:hypothetical protein
MAALTDASKIAAYLGVALTGAQQTQAGVMADAATAWVERYTGKSWQTATPVTDELHTMVRDRVYLNRRPVVAITTVKTRASAFVGFGWTTLDASQYELLDAANGVLLIQGWSANGVLVLASYTHTMNTAPADVALAATMIAAGWLGGALAPGSVGAESISVGQNDVSIKFSESRDDVPTEARSILKHYRSIVIA